MVGTRDQLSVCYALNVSMDNRPVPFSIHTVMKSLKFKSVVYNGIKRSRVKSSQAVTFAFVMPSVLYCGCISPCNCDQTPPGLLMELPASEQLNVTCSRITRPFSRLLQDVLLDQTEVCYGSHSVELGKGRGGEYIHDFKAKPKQMLGNESTKGLL